MKEKIKSVLHKQANPEIAIEMLNHSISGWLNYYGKTATEELLDFLDKFLFREIKLWLSKLVKKSQKTKKYYSGLIFKIRWFSEKSYIQIQKITRELISAASIRKSDSYKKQGKESVDKLILRQKRRYRKVLSKDRDIILANPGVFIGKTQKRAVVKQKRKILREIPFFQLKNILVASPGVSFSSDLIKYCADYDIPVSFIGPNGKVYAHLITPTFPLYYRTNLQLAAFQNGKALSIASSIIICKLKNQMNLLKYYGKYKNRSKLFQESVTESIKNIAAQIDKISCSNFNEDYEKARNQLFALEGQGAAHYWRMVKYLIGSDVFFEKRERRGATDIFNSLLNYGYGIMYSYLFQRIIVARLNPNISYLHKSQGNKPTLVFDLIELFRQPVVDKTIISMIRRRTKFVMDGIWLSQDTKNLVLENIMKRLDQSQYYHGKHFSMRQIIDLEIQLLNNFLEKESKYKPFVQKW
jgi:CRISPR-associated endonuclease Cas1